MTPQNDAEREAQIRSDCNRFTGIGTDDVRFLLAVIDDLRDQLTYVAPTIGPASRVSRASSPEEATERQT